jgi:cyclohexyl-isocyanide hydratase
VRIAMLLFPRLTQLDLTGPHEVLARLPGARVELVAKTLAPVESESGLAIVPTTTFEHAAASYDILFVPGGYGQIAANDDAETLAFVGRVGRDARWVTSACTGALVLGAAGLLRGYRAATHWAFMDLLPLVGAEPVHERVVIDRNRVTGGGVTAGIDIALAIAERACSCEVADTIRVQLEYIPAPEPPPRPELYDRVRGLVATRHAERRAQLERLAQKQSAAGPAGSGLS